MGVSVARAPEQCAGRDDAAISEESFAAESHEAIVSAMRDAAAGGILA